MDSASSQNEQNMQNEGEQAAQRIHSLAARLKAPLESVVFGQSAIVDLLLVCLFSEGHVLLEGLPGTAKTTLVKTLARLLDMGFSRIQLTPDMLPAEITGTSIYDLNTRTFSFRQGPIFTDLLLADEINRTPPKTQSALLEAMEEHQVTADGHQHPLSELFTVIATLNPIEFEGTFPLPEAQLDRFLMKVLITYPSEAAEKQMLQHYSSMPGVRYQAALQLTPVATRADILECRRLLGKILLEESVLDYILQVIQDTRVNPNLELGCSPRSALALLAASRAHAAIRGNAFVSPDDVKAVAPAVMRHRILLTAEAELDELTPDQVIQQTLQKVPIPR
jgi:MoxR-like ATPase